MVVLVVVGAVGVVPTGDVTCGEPTGEITGAATIGELTGTLTGT